MKNKVSSVDSNRRRVIERLFDELSNDVDILDDLLKENHGIDDKHDNFSLAEKAALLRNLGAQSRTHLAWIRTWLSIIGVMLGIIALILLRL